MTELEGGTTLIRDVEVLKVGNWHSGLSGRVPITDQDLDAMVQAATDTEVDQAPLKIGHIDPRFDGEPALGWLTNVRRQGEALVADIADAPAKMADLIQSAFKRRSAEIAWGVKTPSGKTYKAALAGLALLGVTPPAVKGLADVMSRYSGQTEADGTDRVTIVDDSDGPEAEVWRESFAAFAAGVTEYVTTFTADSRDTPTNASDTTSNAPHSAEGDPVALTDEQVREQLGLPADGEVSDKLRAAAEALNQSAAAGAGDKPDDKPTPEPAPTASTAPTTTIDSAALAQLQANAEAGARAMQVLDEQEREGVLAAALSGGKIAPASIDAYRKLWATDKEQTKTLLSSLPAVISTVTNFSAAATNAAGKTVDHNGLTDDDWAALQRTLNL